MDLNEKQLSANRKNVLKGLDGWLGLFQIWAAIFLIIYGLPVFDPALHISSKIIYGSIMMVLVVCMVVFYMRKMAFRILYIVFICLDFAIEVLNAILARDFLQF